MESETELLTAGHFSAVDRCTGAVRFLPYLTIGIVGVLAHGLLLISDTRIWDGWLIENWIREGHWDYLRRFFSEVGMPIHFFIHRPFGIWPNPNLAYKVFSFCCIVSSGLLTFQVLKASRFVGTNEALLTAVIAMTFPGIQTAGEGSVFPYLFCYTLFLLGSWIALRAEGMPLGKHIPARIAACVFFFISFDTNSLLVYYLGFFLLLVLSEQRRRGRSWFQIPWDFLWKRADYFVLPFVFWEWKQRFTPRHGFYSDYNTPHFSGAGCLSGFKRLIEVVIVPPFVEPVIAVFVVVTIVLVLAWFRPVPAGRLLSSQTNTFALGLFGILLLVFGAFPYIAVRQRFVSHGWGTNYSLLIPLPLALLTLTAVRFLFRNPKLRASTLLLPLFVTLIAGFVLQWVQNYVAWQAMGVKERSVFYHLLKIPGARNYSVLEIRNEFIIPKTLNWYPPSVWTYQFASAFGDAKRLVFEKPQGNPAPHPQPYTPSEIKEMIVATTVPYALEEIDPQGQQAILTIRQGPLQQTPVQLALHYWLYRFVQPSKLENFLNQITQIELLPLEMNLIESP